LNKDQPISKNTSFIKVSVNKFNFSSIDEAAGLESSAFLNCLTKLANEN